MEEFNLKKETYLTYLIPNELLFIRKFYNDTCTKTVSFPTLYRVFNHMDDQSFLKKNPSYDFKTLAITYNQIFESHITAKELEDNYRTIDYFYKNVYR